MMARFVIGVRSAENAMLFRKRGAREFVPIVVFFVVALLVLVPLGIMVVTSFRPVGVLPLSAGPWSVQSYRQVFSYSFLSVALNTLWYVAGTLAISVPLAVALAYITERTDVPGRDILYGLMFFPLLIPGFAAAIGWILLAGPRAGLINVYIRDIFAIHSGNGPLNVFTLIGMVLVSVLTFVPPMWLMLIGIFRSMDGTLEDAAATEGASRGTVLRTVTLPLMLPAILAIVVYYCIAIAESFEIPLAIGTSAGIQVVSTRIYDLITETVKFGGVFDYEGAAAIGVVGLVLGLAGIFAYFRLVGNESRYAVVTGGSYDTRRMRLGRWKYVVLIFFALYFFISVFLPISIVIYTSFLRYYVPPTPGSIATIPWTVSNYVQLFNFNDVGRPLLNTLIVAVLAACATTLLAGLISWTSIRVGTPLARIANKLSFLPLAVPGTILSLAFLLTFVGTPLYGTLLLVILAFTTRYITYVTRLMYAAQLQVHRELEEASLANGVNNYRTLLHINLRLLLSAFLNGWLWVLAQASKDFTTPLLLLTASTGVIANVIYGNFESGTYPETCALMVVLILFMALIIMTLRHRIIPRQSA